MCPRTIAARHIARFPPRRVETSVKWAAHMRLAPHAQASPATAQPLRRPCVCSLVLMVRAIRSAGAWMIVALSCVAIALSGCGSSTSGATTARQISPRQEHRLLGLIDKARSDAAARDGQGARGALTQFVAAVRALRRNGSLSSASAVQLARQAQTTGRLASTESPPPSTTTMDPGGTTDTTIPTTATDTTPGGGPAAPPGGGPAAPPGRGPAAPPGHTRDSQGQDNSWKPRQGHGWGQNHDWSRKGDHGHGHHQGDSAPWGGDGGS